MTNLRSTKINLMLVVILAFLSAIMLISLPRMACAEGHHSRNGEFYDARYGHNHYYPNRGHYVGTLPGGYRAFYHGHDRYYFHGGVWYRPYGSRFLIVAPPLGLFIPFLPPYYSTIWVSGVPYYYANDVYYVQSGNGYMVVSPPADAVVNQEPPQQMEAPTQPEKLYIYPRKGQSEKKQADDKYECHRWAVSQTNYDPTRPGGTTSDRKYEDYKRAMSACLDARGYTVK
ncbi:MAG: DUF6515 family protein [Smithella sp.]